MTDTFISAGTDGTAIAAALVDRLLSRGITVAGTPEAPRIGALDAPEGGDEMARKRR